MKVQKTGYEKEGRRAGLEDKRKGKKKVKKKQKKEYGKGTEEGMNGRDEVGKTRLERLSKRKGTG